MSSDDDQPGQPGEQRQALLREISTNMAAIQKNAFGKGPEGAKSYLFDDLLLIVMREGLTVAEKTMLGFGRQDLVREFRQQFENEMTSRIVGMVEDMTERKVLTYQSQVMFDPDVIVELFVFDRATDGGFVAAEIRAEEISANPLGNAPSGIPATDATHHGAVVDQGLSQGGRSRGARATAKWHGPTAPGISA